MKKYTLEGQNIYVTTTTPRVITELFAIATSVDNAITIVAALRVIEDVTNIDNAIKLQP